MNPIDDEQVRGELRRAVAPLDPTPPSLASVRARAVRRHRQHQAGGGIAVLAMAAAAAVVFVVAQPSSNATVSSAAQPSAASFHRYAAAHGARKEAGPFTGGSGSYGMFTTKQAIVVAQYRHGAWSTADSHLAKIGAGRFVLRLRQGPQLGDSSTPTFYLREIGGDVSYFGYVLHLTDGGWRPTMFAGCGHHGLCYTPSDSEPYGHLVGGKYVSVNNNCTPYCAAGTDYRITWRWSPASERFVAASSRPLAE